ncbi:MAG: xanthine dehydrogenase family protein subunit M [Rhodobacteraceae bacterium]|nr:xanthine dehydrogenase family protein subunit M [Paracoccaceae bacterium]
MDYVAPATISEAVGSAHAASGSVRFLAGGTDVLVQLRSGMHTPDIIIDVKNIPGMLDVARNNDGGWTIGAAVPGIRIGEVAELRSDWPGVVEAMELIGSTQIQGRASLIGNLCNGSPAADVVPALFAAAARVSIAGPQGEREVGVSEIPVGPGRNSLAKGEIITALHLPPRRAAAADAYLRFIPRTEMDIAVVGCAVNLSLNGDRVAEASVALGAVAPTVLSVPEAAAALVGSQMDSPALDRMSAACSAACRPIDDKRGTVEFRTDVAGVLGRRAAVIAYNRAGRE